VLTDKPMNRVDAYRMVRRRTADAGFRVKLGCHVFRATGITAYLVFIGGIGGGCPCQAPQDQDQARLPPDGAKADPSLACFIFCFLRRPQLL
jgi:hypothetical protein